MKVRAKKSLGQNFLVDENVLEKIAAFIPAGTPLLLEIGPGQGALTRKLSARAEKLCLLEKDEALLADTLKKLKAEGTKVAAAWEGDALDFDYGRIWTETESPRETDLMVAANLPYNVATEIVFRLLEHRAHISKMVLMFQKEVAERIAAEPGGRDFGTISVLIQNFYECEEVLRIKPGAFRPRPKVDSSVVEFRRREKPILDLDAAEWTRFSSFIRNVFRYRRKTLENSLKMLGMGGSHGKKNSTEALRDAGIAGQRRAETLSIEEFGALFRELGS